MKDVFAWLCSDRASSYRSKGKYIGICGQGPSDNPEFAAWLMANWMESISLSPDSVIDTWQKPGSVQ